jgi:hypothetical protein
LVKTFSSKLIPAKFIIIGKVNIKEKFSLFHDHWNPGIVGELNGQQLKLVKFKGEFVWHKHDHENQQLRMKYPECYSNQLHR